MTSGPCRSRPMRALVSEQSSISVLETWTPEPARARAVSPRCPSTKARGSSSALLRLAPITTLGYRCIREERDTRPWLLIGQITVFRECDWLELPGEVWTLDRGTGSGLLRRRDFDPEEHNHHLYIFSFSENVNFSLFSGQRLT